MYMLISQCYEQVQRWNVSCLCDDKKEILNVTLIYEDLAFVSKTPGETTSRDEKEKWDEEIICDAKNINRGHGEIEKYRSVHNAILISRDRKRRNQEETSNEPKKT